MPPLRLTASVFLIAVLSMTGLLLLARRAEPRSAASVEIQIDGDDVYLARLWRDGSGRRRISHDQPQAEAFRSPAWSGDGRYIVFVDYSLHDVPAWGGEIRALTDTYDGSPSGSPDGRQIAFASFRDNNWDIYTLDFPSGQTRRLTTRPEDDHSPTWSPDGKWIAFIGHEQAFNQGVYRMRPDGAGLTPLFADKGMIMLRWSWDGAWLYHLSGNQYARYNMAAGASEAIRPSAMNAARAPHHAPIIDLDWSPLALSGFSLLFICILWARGIIARLVKRFLDREKD